MGVVLNVDNKKVSYITDLGFFPEKYYPYINDSDVFILEANHNLYDLMNCKTRPKIVKERTRSPLGHLSNGDAIYTVIRAATKSCSWIVFHMSDETNSKESFEKDLINSGYNPFLINYYIANKTNITKVVLDD
jgi:phosphoribosyl 1,2-cyclic phosphodiesterase